MKNSFKVGDIVKATDATNGVYGITCKKNNFVGKVISVETKDCEMTLKTLKSDVADYVGEIFYGIQNSNRLFEKVNEESKPKKETPAKKVKSAKQGVEIILKEVGDGKTTVATLSKGGRVIKTAFAYCSPEDDYDAEIGCAVAFSRLLGIDTNEIV